MIWQTILKKYSMLALGVLLMTIFLTSKEGKDFIGQYRSNYIPSDCRALIQRTSARPLIKKQEWIFSCEAEELSIEVPFQKEVKNAKQKRGLMYRDLANKLVTLAKESNEETLERINLVRLSLVSRELTILAQSNGQDLVKFQTLSEPKNIMEHLQKTVKVKEITE